jgi:hypothetical protein
VARWIGFALLVVSGAVIGLDWFWWLGVLAMSGGVDPFDVPPLLMRLVVSTGYLALVARLDRYGRRRAGPRPSERVTGVHPWGLPPPDRSPSGAGHPGPAPDVPGSPVDVQPLVGWPVRQRGDRLGRQPGGSAVGGVGASPDGSRSVPHQVSPQRGPDPRTGAADRPRSSSTSRPGGSSTSS